jgi:hydrogenase maturation protein HypF
MAEELTQLPARTPSVVACDGHPDYYTTRLARRFGLPIACVPHHLAHILSGMVESGLDAPVLGIAWDGTGYGGDGTVWGGEFIRVSDKSFRRVAHLLTFALPGGAAAVREPRRAALGLLHALYGTNLFACKSLVPVATFSAAEQRVLLGMLQGGVNTPLTSSAGRLFDAVAAILGLCQCATFEGEAAMAVEFAADRAGTATPLPPPELTGREGDWTVDWRPMIAELVDAIVRGIPPELLARALHEGLAEAVVAVAERVGIARVLLTGGCFQNARLTKTVMEKLGAAGFTPFRHLRIPPNDGGLAVGQVLFAARPLSEERC